MGVTKRRRNRVIAINACAVAASKRGWRLTMELSVRQRLRELVKGSVFRVLQRRDTAIRFKPTPPLSELCRYVNGVVSKGPVIYLGNKLKAATSSPLLGPEVSFSDDRTKIGRVFDTDITRAYPHSFLADADAPDNLRSTIESFRIRIPKPRPGHDDYAYAVDTTSWEW